MIRPLFLVLFLVAFLGDTTSARAWWDKAWTARKAITIDTTGATGSEIAGPIGGAAVLVRLHEGNFNFAAVKEDGSDIRFVSEDDKTVLPSQVEKFDPLLNEAIVWVRVPEVKPGAQTKVWLYSGNPDAEPLAGEQAMPFDAEAVAAYKFADGAAAPRDATSNKNNAETAGTPSEGALIGPGLRLLGDKPIVIPTSPTLALATGDAFTFSAWVKQTVAQPDATLFNRVDGNAGLRIGVANGVPYVEVRNGGSPQRATAAEPIALNAWANVAVTAADGTITLYVNGQSAATLSAALPALNAPLELGAGPGAIPGFIGEIDQVELAKAARPAGALLLAARSQGTSAAAEKLVQFGEDEGGHGGGHNEALEHVLLFGDIAKNMMFDGWIAVGVCIIMMIVGWGVAVQKLMYLNKIQKGTDEFIRQWSQVSTDLTAIDHRDANSVSTLGGKVSPKVQKLMKASPLYHIYHIGSEEIRHRLESKNGAFKGLSGRSIQAIRASLEAGLTREVTRLNDKLVFLTISIAGGPYVGLLGTVVGVMITFAVIAKSGEVDINSIAPGIASALLATVFGLLVAIPALFIYSYLAARIKDATTNMQIFIDEFVTKMAEFYPQPVGHEEHQATGPGAH